MLLSKRCYPLINHRCNNYYDFSLPFSFQEGPYISCIRQPRDLLHGSFLAARYKEKYLFLFASAPAEQAQLLTLTLELIRLRAHMYRAEIS